MEKKLTQDQLEYVRSLMVKSLIGHTWIDPHLKELLSGVVLDIRVTQSKRDPDTKHVEELTSLPLTSRKRVKLEVLPLPPHKGDKFTHYVLATMPSGMRHEVAQYKSERAASLAREKLIRSGFLVGLLRMTGGSYDAECEPDPDELLGG